MNWKQEEAWNKMLGLLTEAQTSHPQVKTNKLLEAMVYGIGVLICKEERNDRKTRKRSETD